MIILFTQPAFAAGEALLLNRFLEQQPSLIAHLRKPGSERPAYEQLIQEIHPAFHSRLVLHQYHELDSQYALKGIHFTETDRLTGTYHPRVVSTSFHRMEDALQAPESLTYFFCSPVFPSISKEGYVPTEDWTIVNTSPLFRSKAVALGGIDASRLEPVRQRGFEHIAVLGAIWQAPQPETALAELFDRF